MVEGLDRFGNHFAAYTDQYVLIGDAACTLAMDEAGLTFRATKDLDIVLCVPAQKIDVKTLGLGSETLEVVLAELRAIYGLD